MCDRVLDAELEVDEARERAIREGEEASRKAAVLLIHAEKTIQAAKDDRVAAPLRVGAAGDP